MLVIATREGLTGKRTASGWIIDNRTPFVALPSRRALNLRVRVTNPLNGKMCEATVLDVGPWNIDDVDYVFNGARPLAEQGIKTNGRMRVNGTTNGAGIDLGEAVYQALQMNGNTEVDWEFIDHETQA